MASLDDILWPAVAPIETGMLDVGDGHSIYWERSGNPDAPAVVLLHGGPGGGSDPLYRRYADAGCWHIIQFDQRGCGRSEPAYSLAANTTWHLVEDIERLRRHLGISSWTVFGGSWGSTLALAYAQKHAAAVDALVLRGIFLGTQREYDWLYGDGVGASRLFPDAYAPFRDLIPVPERGDMVGAYMGRLTEGPEAEQLEAARRWSRWEMSVSRLLVDPEIEAKADEAHFARALARIECHYFVNDCWLEPDQLLRDVERLQGIPAIIVHGRYDVICAVDEAWKLHQAWPGSELVITPRSGHSMTEPENAAALVAALDRFADQRS